MLKRLNPTTGTSSDDVILFVCNTKQWQNAIEIPLRNTLQKSGNTSIFPLMMRKRQSARHATWRWPTLVEQQICQIIWKDTMESTLCRKEKVSNLVEQPPPPSLSVKNLCKQLGPRSGLTMLGLIWIQTVCNYCRIKIIINELDSLSQIGYSSVVVSCGLFLFFLSILVAHTWALHQGF